MDKALTAIGLMSGTSLDGIDVALLRTDGQSYVQPGPFLPVPYDKDFQSQLANALQVAKKIKQRNERPSPLAEIEREITLRHAQAVRQFIDQNGLKADKIDLIGFHGQTVLHKPQDGLTVQLGDGTLLSQQLGIPVVYDMRANDMAQGGQGAPLAPAYHQAVAKNFDKKWLAEHPVCFVNIGGISNVTYIDGDNAPISFDCGPGNVLIDQWVAKNSKNNSESSFDKGGALGLKGHVNEEIAEDYIRQFQAEFADGRSLDRLNFTPLTDDAISLSDGARTLAAVTARLIAASRTRFPALPKLWVLGGGGRLNGAIIKELKQAVGEKSTIVLAEDVGISGDALEAQAWAYLSVRAIKGLPLTFPTTTGVKLPMSGGVLIGF